MKSGLIIQESAGIHPTLKAMMLHSLRCCRVVFSFYFILFLTEGGEVLNAQTGMVSHPNKNPSVDSLLRRVKEAKTDSAKLLEYYYWIQRINYPPDSVNSAVASFYTNEALLLAEKANFKKGIGWAFFNHAEIARKQRNYAEALKNYFIVLKIAEDINDRECIRNLYSSIGKVYYEIRNYSEALKYHVKSVEMARQDGSGDLEAFLLFTGDAYRRNGNYSDALKCYFEFIEVHDMRLPQLMNGDKIMARNIGETYADMGKYTEALKHLFAALKIQLESGFKPQLCILYKDIGAVYNKQANGLAADAAKEKYNEAISYFTKCIELSWAINYAETRLDAYSGKSISYKGLADPVNELAFLNRYLELKDSLFNNDLYNGITGVRIQYEVEKTQLEEKARQQLIITKEQATRERLLADQKLQQEKMLSDERVNHAKEMADQQLKQQLAVAEEKSKADKSIALEKARQERIGVEKQQMNNLLLIGLGFVILTAVFLILYIRQTSLKRRAVEKAEAIHKMAELEMQSLRSQLNPHFMFNSLNSIQTLIMTEQTDKSQSYLSRFARLLRMLLENADKPFVPLQTEMEFLQLYLGLESLRIPDLQYSFSTVSGLNTDQILIPNMILQPYVENAIWHGLSHKESNKQLQIRVSRENGTMHYEIEDNGVGRKKAGEMKSFFSKQHQSKGMELINKRITLLNKEYMSTIQTEVTDVIKNNEVAGTLVSIKVPVMLLEPAQN